MSRIPTTDLYFLNSCGHRVARWLKPGPIYRLGQNGFRVGKTRLLIRRDTNKVMTDMRQSNGRFIYLIDDDIEGAEASLSLPEGYRVRLMDFHVKHHRALTRRADILVVTSSVLQEQFAWHPDVRLLHPVWHLPMADLSHFQGIESSQPIRAVHLGSGSHGDGVAFLRPVLQELLQRHERLHFTYINADAVLGSLDNHPRVERIKPRSWMTYRRWLAKQRFHIGLYPLPNTPFHRARSRNKLLEYGAVGAMGVYSSHWRPAQVLAGNSLLCGPEQRQWTDALSDLLRRPEAMTQMARGARNILVHLNDPVNQRKFWSDVLEIDCL